MPPFFRCHRLLTLSASLWQAIDRQLTNAAVWIPTVASREVERTSNRLQNYEYNPVWGFLADQAWSDRSPPACITRKRRSTGYA